MELDNDLEEIRVSDATPSLVCTLVYMIQRLRNELSEQRHDLVCDILTDGL